MVVCIAAKKKFKVEKKKDMKNIGRYNMQNKRIANIFLVKFNLLFCVVLKCNLFCSVLFVCRCYIFNFLYSLWIHVMQQILFGVDLFRCFVFCFFFLLLLATMFDIPLWHNQRPHKWTKSIHDHELVPPT